MGYLVLAYVVLNSIILFVMMGMDKSKAKKNEWRIAERTLFTIAVFGGALGGVIGMYVFRHKTNHTNFSIGFPVLAVIHLLIVFFLFT